MRLITLSSLFQQLSQRLKPISLKETCVKPKDPMWIIILKVIAYIIGLLLGGVVTTSCASHF